jgi:ATP-dependent protease ClpP protease subunit
MITVIGEINADTFQRYADLWDDRDHGVLISSPGGDIGYTLAMLDDIDECKRNTWATGICQSAAAVLATAGEGRRVCTMDTLFRFIPPETEKINDPATGEEIEKVPDLRYYLHSVLVARLAQRLKWALPETYDLFNGQFITSTRAKELGLVDEVISTEVKNGNID